MMPFSNRLEYRISFYLSFLISLLVVGGIIKGIDFPDHTLQRAKDEGIISRTILDNYNDNQESLNYAFAVAVTPLLSLLILFLADRFIKQDRKADNGVSEKNRIDRNTETVIASGGKKILYLFKRYVFPILLIVYIIYDPNFLSRWHGLGIFMIDEGSQLASINEILSGKVLYRDTFCLYGPLATYLAVFLMKIFDPHIFIWRSYVLWLSVAGFLIIYYSLFVFRLSRIMRWAAFALITILYYPVVPGFSWTSIRVALGILALALYIRHINSRKLTPLLLSGTVSATAIFTSQEIGVSAILAIGTGIMLLGWKELSYHKLLIHAGCYILGILPVCALVLLFFYLNDGLSAFLTGFIEGPSYFLKGWGALPFPNLTQDISLLCRNASWEQLIQFMKIDIVSYFPIVLYLGLLSHYMIKVLNRDYVTEDFPYICLLIFGIVLFKSALARSDQSHILYASLPSVILAVKLIDSLVQRVFEKRGLPWVISAPIGALIAVSLLSFLVIDEAYVKMLAIKNRITGSHPHTLETPAYRESLSNYNVIKTERGKGLKIPGPYAESLDLTVSFIQKRTRPQEPIFVFPNEAGFYFLTGRPSAASHVLSQQMITRRQRQEVVAQLEEVRPRYVIFGTLLNTRPDKIPKEQENPEVLNYIKQNYMMIKKLYGIMIYMRIR